MRKNPSILDLKENDLVWFYGISTIVSHLISNLFYANILNMISKHILLITFLNEPELIFFSYS